MIGEIVDIEYEDGAVNIGKIVSDEGSEYAVVGLCLSMGLFKFSKVAHKVPKESIAGFYDTKNLEDTGLFTKVDETYYDAVDTSDEDFEYESGYDSETESDISLISESS